MAASRRASPLLTYTAKLHQHPENLTHSHQVKRHPSASMPVHKTVPAHRKYAMAYTPNNISFTCQVFVGTSSV